jgi:hypothetical protein
MAELLGKVDLLGLNSFGKPVGMSPLWGMMIGGGVSGVTSMALSRTGKAGRAPLFGFLAGLATSGIMYSMRSTRHAAFGAVAGAFFASGLKWLEGVLFGVPVIVAAPSQTHGVGLPMMQPLNGLGLPMMQPLNGQFGLPSASNIVPPQGTIPGVAGPQMSGGVGNPPVHLLGQQLHAGGPRISGLSARYGATLLGGRI